VRHTWVVLACLGSALAFATSSSLKHVSAGQAPDAQSLHPHRLGAFVRATVVHRLWLGGIACDAIGVTLQALALHFGALVIVQPLLTLGLVFALLLRRWHDHREVSHAQVGWAVLLTVSLAGFVILTLPAAGPVHRVDRAPAAFGAIIGAVVAAVCVELGRRQRGPGRTAALMGLALGVVYAGTAALLKAITDVGARSPWHVLASWQLYVALLLGAIGLLVNQIAFQAGPLPASLPAAATLDPVVSIIIGITVYDEHVRRGPGGGTLLVALLLVLCAAIIQLARVNAAAEAQPPARE
jgi:drug/metabolite transporter (DMT)-like permease